MYLSGGVAVAPDYQQKSTRDEGPIGMRNRDGFLNINRARSPVESRGRDASTD
jgi:hypothetical protein